MPASAFGGRFNSSTQLLIVEGSMLGRKISSNQECRRILRRGFSQSSTRAGEKWGIINSRKGKTQKY